MNIKKTIIGYALVVLMLTGAIGCTDNAKSTENVKSTESVENTENVKNTENVESTESTENNKNKENTQKAENNNSINTNTQSNMTVSFIDVGQADCILIESDGEFMLVDAGNNDDAVVIKDYLDKRGVKRLKYVIGTHPHEDHIGSMDMVIDTYETENVIMPDAVTTTKTFEDVLTSVFNKGLSITSPEVGDTYDIGDARFTIIAPNDDYADELNNWSVGIKLVYGDNSFVMCGDAEIEAEYDIIDNGIDISADVLKVGHHGSDTSTSQAFLKAVNPSYAVISVGKDNTYGHPHKETIERLKDAGITIYRTDEQQTIVAESDGKNIKFFYGENAQLPMNVPLNEADENEETKADEPSMSQTENEAVNNDESKENSEEIKVHITENGKKYHMEGCTYLNKSDISVTLKEAKARGLEPCNKCNPPKN